MNERIHDIYQHIMSGDATYINWMNIRFLNETAMFIYERRDTELDVGMVSILKEIIMICNVLYNRTDLNVQPIEDGVYDLLLELYKRYDPNFQVGSAIVEFNNILNNGIDSAREERHSPIVFFDHAPRDYIHQFIYDRLNDIQMPNRFDCMHPGIEFMDRTYITKRSHDTSHNHPDLVGTLDKCKFVTNKDAIEAGVFEDPTVTVFERDFFQKHIKDGIINPNDKIQVVCELKYDGISVEADCNERVMSARTRGDTGIGKASDITPMLQGYRFPQANSMIGQKPIGVKFEAIMKKSDLFEFNRRRERSYANCRSAIVGLFGASDAYLYQDLITLVPLAIDRQDVPQISNRLEEILFINDLFRSHGEPLRYCYLEGTVSELIFLIKAFHDEAVLAKDYLDFMFDGIVVSYINEDIRNRLGRKNYINKYSIAIKFNPMDKQTSFLGYTFEVGSNGRITPMIHYNPVEFNGTIHTKSSGSSYGRFQELALKSGDYITVTYRNDVMPYVSRLECEHNRENPNPVVPFIDKCPVCGSPLIFSQTMRDAYCGNFECDGRTIARMVRMFNTLNIKGFAESTFKRLGLKHLYQLPEMNDANYLIERLGEADGKSFQSIIHSILHDQWLDYMVFASLGFSGIGLVKAKNLLQVISVQDLYDLYCNNRIHFKYALTEKLSGSNIGKAVIDVISNEISLFEPEIKFICDHMHLIQSTMPEDALVIRFSGIRDLELCQLLQQHNIDAGEGGVTKKTNILIVPYNGFDSTNVRKAERYNVKIATIDEFKTDVKYYTGLDIQITC